MHLHSHITRGGTRAQVYICTATGSKRPFANIFRDNGFWHVQSMNTGNPLMPMTPHTQRVRNGRHMTDSEVQLGVILKLLREKIVGLSAPKPAAIAA